MALAEILAVGTTAESSSDITVADGSPLTVALKDAAGPKVTAYAAVHIELKDDAGAYFTIDTLTPSKPAVVIYGAGTYRFRRPAGASCGVFRAA